MTSFALVQALENAHGHVGIDIDPTVPEGICSVKRVPRRKTNPYSQTCLVLISHEKGFHIRYIPGLLVTDPVTSPKMRPLANTTT